MTRTLLASLCIANGFCVCCAAPGTGDNPFQSITLRNVFGLRPAVPVQVTGPQANLPKVILTGISTMLGTKEALLEILAAPVPAKPSKPDWCILKEGQREGPVEIVRIDEKAGTVLVNNSGTVTNLTFGNPVTQAVAAQRPPPRTFPRPFPQMYPNPVYRTARRY
jgi:hypothetical protein